MSLSFDFSFLFFSSFLSFPFLYFSFLSLLSSLIQNKNRCFEEFIEEIFQTKDKTKIEHFLLRIVTLCKMWLTNRPDDFSDRQFLVFFLSFFIPFFLSFSFSLSLSFFFHLIRIQFKYFRKNSKKLSKLLTNKKEFSRKALRLSTQYYQK